MALYTDCVLNATHDSLSLLNEEVYPLRKGALQNRYAHCITRRGVCPSWGQMPCMHSRCPSQCQPFLTALASETHGMEHLTGGPLQEWWASLTTEWQWGLAVLGGSACVLAACCCSLYCWCGIWVQGSALLVKRPSWKTPLCGLYGEEP